MLGYHKPHPLLCMQSHRTVLEWEYIETAIKCNKHPNFDDGNENDDVICSDFHAYIM
jgi:hypothetical protein